MWSDVIDFAVWYYKKGMPHKIPNLAPVFRTDSASSFCVYRDGRYQVEIYLIDVNAPIPTHQHYGADAVEFDHIMFRATDESNLVDFLSRNTLRSGESHGGGIEARAAHTGFYLTSIQHWMDDLPMTTLSSRWVGKTVGPKHDKLIATLNPGAYVVQGYADVTKKMELAA